MQQQPQKSRLSTLLLAVVVVQLIIFFGHWLIYQTVIFAFALNDWQIRAWFGAAMAFMSLTFMSAQIMVATLRSKLVDAFYLAASVWLGSAHIILLGCGAFWLVAAVTFRTGIAVPWAALSIALFVLVVVTDLYALWNGSRIRITKYDIHLENLPEAWRGGTMVMVSDTHFGNIRRLKSSEKMVRMVNAQKPDLVLIPGDFFDGPPADYLALAAPVRDIQSRFGVYFTEGNHEEFRDPAPYLAALRAAGVTILNNEVIDLEGLQIVGVPYAASYHGKDVRPILARIPYDQNRPTILMKHAPSARRAVAAAGISLMVSGHTHKGQMWPFSLFARHLFGRAVYGYTRKNGLQTITSSGFGTWGPPQRLGTKSEMVVVKFV